MKDIIIAGPPRSGKTDLVNNILLSLFGDVVFISSVSDAHNDIRKYAVSLKPFNDSITHVTLVFDGIIITPSAAVRALEIVKHFRETMRDFEITAIYVDNGANFVLTDKTN